jgi:hypothetical protein
MVTMSQRRKFWPSESRPTSTLGGVTLSAYLDRIALPSTPEQAREAHASSDDLANWNLESLRVHEDFGVEIESEPVLTSIPVRKPGKQEWVRVHPGAEWRETVGILTWEEDKSSYLVIPALAEALMDEVYSTVLYTAINRAGKPFLWPIRLTFPDRPGGGDSWYTAGHAAAKLAETTWVRVKPNMPGRCYDVYEARGLAEPIWPARFTSFTELLPLAFKDRFIASLSHPIVRRLREGS